jgi:8-oxo-dGTP diphosphatase
MLFVVAVALRNDAGEILVQQRPDGKPLAGLWEFAGGKVAAGEHPEDALIRELQEELGIAVEKADITPLSFVTYPLNEKTAQPDNAGCSTSTDDYLLLLLYDCTRWEGEIIPQENQLVQWVTVEILRTLPMPPADIPLIKTVANTVTQSEK